MIMQLCFFALLFIFALAIPREARAYLDPGTGSFVTQIIIAAFATVLFSVKLFWKKIKDTVFRFIRSVNEEKK